MCLDVRSERLIADEDIVCYKRLIFNYRTEQFIHGSKFEGVIGEYSCSGHISVNEDEGIFFCTDISGLNGCNVNEKFGHPYSWALDEEVCKIFVDGVELNYELQTPYIRTSIEIGETYFSDLKLNVEKAEVHVGLHSFVELFDAEGDGIGTYVQCIIPKGSEYYKGMFNWAKSYASNALKYVKIVDC